MFCYSKYSNYNLFDINNRGYNAAVERLLIQAKNCPEEIYKKVYAILFEGGFEGFSVNSNITTPDNRDHEVCRRLNLASLLIFDPQTFDVIYRNNAILYHGTNSNALETILQHGMYSKAKALKNGLQVLSGETSYLPRDFISFTDKLNLALGYSTFSPSADVQDKPSFSVLIGISADDLRNPNREISTSRISSDTPEIGIWHELSTKYIKFIAVPGSKVPEVRSLIEHYGLDQIEVVPSEGIALSTNAAAEYNPDQEYICRPEDLIIAGKESVLR